MRRLLSFLTIFFLAAAFLNYEILLMRLLSIVNWSHYAYMVVSLAVLGMGFSGVILALFPKFFKHWRREIILICCFLFSIAIPFAFNTTQKLPTNFLYLIWDWRQFFYLGISYFLYGIPFLIVSMILAVFFLEHPKETGKVYAANLLGSGCGVILAIGLMYIIPPEWYLTATALFAALAGFFWGMRSSSGFKKISITFLFGAFILYHCLFSHKSLIANVSEYKGLSGLLRLPNTKIINRLYNPLGLIHVLEGQSIRLAPGLSINFKREIPSQKAFTIDAGSPSPIIASAEDPGNLQFLDKTIFSAGYSLVKRPKVLLIGADGGSDVLLAKHNKSSSVTILEMNKNIIRAIDVTTEDISHNLYRSPGVRLFTKEARGYIEETNEKFDIIQLKPTGTLSASASGVYAQNEDYLNTVQAYHLFYQRLSPSGIFIVSRWIKVPARDGLKLFASGFEFLKKSGIKHPKKQLALIRNWDIITLLIKSIPFTHKEIQTLKEFCAAQNFDISYLPGIKESEVNRFNKLPKPIYYTGARNIINPRTKDKFFASYPFNIRPATDDKPYFSNSFRWSALPHLLKTLGREWIPFTDYGYLVLLTTFMQALIIGGLIILLPMGILLQKRDTTHTPFNPSVWIYFAVLGFSYMVLEMALIQKFILFLHHPIYSMSLVIASFLLLSGCGSLISNRFLQKEAQFQIIPFIAIVLLGVLYTFTLDPLFSHFKWAPMYLRLIIAFLVITPLAFFMGIPFPFGLQKIVPSGEKNTGGAWGYNGYFSVIGTISTPILANLLGFRIVAMIGCLGYLTAMTIWIRNFFPQKARQENRFQR